MASTKEIKMKKYSLVLVISCLLGCDVAEIDTTYSTNADKTLKEISEIDSISRTEIYQNFYQTEKSKFGHLPEAYVVNCMSDYTFNKDRSLTLSEVGTWCTKAYMQGRDFSQYKNHENAPELEQHPIFKRSLTDVKRNNIEHYFRTEEEPNVYGATFSSDKGILRLGVSKPDTFNEDYATYVCEKLQNMGVEAQDVTGINIMILEYKFFNNDDLNSPLIVNKICEL